MKASVFRIVCWGEVFVHSSRGFEVVSKESLRICRKASKHKTTKNSRRASTTADHGIQVTCFLPVHSITVDLPISGPTSTSNRTMRRSLDNRAQEHQLKDAARLMGMLLKIYL